MFFSFILLTHLLFSFPMLCSGSTQTPGTQSTQANPASKPIDNVPTMTKNKKLWIENMQRTLPELLCQDTQYFVQCFKTTSQECSAFTKLLVEACLNNIILTLPEELDTQQGEYWGKMVGRCSYDLYEKFMQPKKRDPNCHLQNTKKQK